MALVAIIGKVMLAFVMMETAYDEGRRADYPNLAGKLNQ
jgi:hypothetical protein